LTGQLGRKPDSKSMLEKLDMFIDKNVDTLQTVIIGSEVS